MTAKSRAHKVQKELKRKKNNGRSAPQPDPSSFEERRAHPGEGPRIITTPDRTRDAIPKRELGFFGTWTPEIQSFEDELERHLRQSTRPYNQGTD